MLTLSRRTAVVTACITLALVTGIFSGLVLRGGNGDARAQESDPTRRVSVSGEGHVTLPPDTAYLSLGVDILNPDLATAQSTAAVNMQAVIDALMAAGVAEKDIQTSSYSIYLERAWDQPGQPITGYHVSQSVTAKVHDLDKAGDTLAAAVDAGANMVQGVWFGLEDPGNAVQQARELAIVDAKAKAEELARLTDSTLGAVLTISESYAPSNPPVAYDGRSAALEQGAVAPPINPGQTEVVLTVQVTYTLN